MAVFISVWAEGSKPSGDMFIPLNDVVSNLLWRDNLKRNDDGDDDHDDGDDKEHHHHHLVVFI